MTLEEIMYFHYVTDMTTYQKPLPSGHGAHNFKSHFLFPYNYKPSMSDLC